MGNMLNMLQIVVNFSVDHFLQQRTTCNKMGFSLKMNICKRDLNFGVLVEENSLLYDLISMILLHTSNYLFCFSLQMQIYVTNSHTILLKENRYENSCWIRYILTFRIRYRLDMFKFL